MDYRLEALGSRSFEHLIQALALKYLGIATVVFGDGPDGGREATYTGPVSHEGWDGYVVIQAKFRQRPEGTAADGKWLLKTLRTELAAYVKEGSKRRKPQYYVLVTNVTVGSETKDEILALLGEFEGADLWDYDKLRVLLDGSPDVARTYCAWITPGDVLHAALSALERATPDFEGTLSRFLQAEIRSDQYANLEQAGHNPDDRVPMASVFVDLPVSPLSGRADRSTPFVARVLELAAERLAPSCGSSDEVAGLREDKRRGRIVLVGGPGQGKTTLGQFLCQLFRAAILLERKAALEPEVRQVASLVREWCERDGYGLPSVRRFPLRISLSEFAQEIAEEPTLSLLGYVVRRIEARTSRTVDATLFADWLRHYPWLLVLDGLDEVPASSNRRAVMAAIKDFMIEVAESDADILVIATTRPQGYGEEFDPRHYRHDYLVPLDGEQALGYGDRLAEVRFGENPERVGRVLGRLRSAVAHPTTARLMTSPLQVTIMTILVDKQGHPPQERWSLFSAYYAAIYSRELERDVPTSKVLRDHKTNVDAIHRRVGLVLQADSERTARTDARMSTDRFRELVRSRLLDEGYSGEGLDALEEDIVQAAAHRLVFLVGLEEGLVGFEIRSLQEFMAAEGIMEGGDQVIRDRLTAIAVSPAWRNVFLFAAGRCFADRQHLRDTVYTIAASINEDCDRAVRLSLQGSRLALDILEEGTVAQQPKYAQLFARLALRAVELPAAPIHDRLAQAYGEALRNVYEEELARGLEHLGAWRSLLELAARDVSWAVALATNAWPAEPERALETLQASAWSARPIASAGLAERLVNEALRHEVWDTTFTTTLMHALAGAPVPPAMARAVAIAEMTGPLGAHRLTVRTGLVGLGLLNLELHSLRAFLDAALPPHAEGLQSANRSWQVVNALARFHEERSPGSAAQVLRSAAVLLKDVLPTRYRTALVPGSRPVQFLADLPWPFVALICSATSAEEVVTRADHLAQASSDLVDEWQELEERWQSEVLDLTDLVEAFDPERPLGCAALAAASWVIPELARFPNSVSAEGSVLDTVGGLSADHRRLISYLAVRALATSSLIGHDDRTSPVTMETLAGLLSIEPRAARIHGLIEVFAACANTEMMSAEQVLEHSSVIDDAPLRRYRRPRPAGLEQLRRSLGDALAQDVMSPGLLKLVATCSVPTAGDLPAIHNFDTQGDTDLALAKLLLTVDPHADEPEAVAQCVANLNSSPGASGLDLVQERVAEASEEWLVAYLSVLMSSHPAYAIAELHELVARRLSPLAFDDAWSQLEFSAPPRG